MKSASTEQPAEQIGKRSPQSHPLGPQISEALLARLWREKATRHSLFVTSRGHKIKVLYPGRLNTLSGPDFKDALFYQDGLGLVRGDVELHLTSQDWQAHGHHRDANYNSVTLHAVAGAADKDTPLSSGMEAPVISLSSLMKQQEGPQHAQHDDVLCKLLAKGGYQKPSCRDEAINLLERAGTARFLGKSRSFHRQMKNQLAQEVLYQALMEALGYSQNRHGFLELARQAPYGVVSRLVQASPPNLSISILEQHLLGVAGFANLLPNSLFSGVPMAPASWRLFRVRPSNHPRQRIRGVAGLMARYCRAGLIQGLAELVIQGSKASLEKGLIVEDASGGPAFIGTSRAADMAVNMVLPFLHGWGLEKSDKPLASAALGLFQCWPPLENNSHITSTEAVLFPSRWLPLACRACEQQGVLHLQRLLKGENAEPV